MIKLILSILIITFSSISFANTIYLECKGTKNNKSAGDFEVSINENNDSLSLFYSRGNKSLPVLEQRESTFKLSPSFFSNTIYGSQFFRVKGQQREMVISVNRHDLSVEIAMGRGAKLELDRSLIQGKCKKVSKDSAI